MHQFDCVWPCDAVFKHVWCMMRVFDDARRVMRVFDRVSDSGVWWFTFVPPHSMGASPFGA
jgi:hypothetical protein